MIAIVAVVVKNHPASSPEAPPPGEDVTVVWLVVFSVDIDEAVDCLFVVIAVPVALCQKHCFVLMIS